jgi:hypothetical protein
MNSLTTPIDGNMMIPDLLRACPAARPVLDRYGLRGCGGPAGPVESLAFFAKAHDVSIQQLLDEVRGSLRSPGAPPAAGAAPGAADTIYRPFFKAGIAVVLTLGAAWGAYLLIRIALRGSFTAVGLHEVNAHGQAQIFGWVGLFVMGFAYQAFPRFKHAALALPRVAYASLVVMLAGIVTRSLAEPLADALAWTGPVAVGGAALEVVAVGLFAWVVVQTWRRSGKPLAFYDYYIACALFWFVVQAVYEAVYLAATLRAASPEGLVALVATWQGALRDIQIHGFALLMILGVSQRLLHHVYGFPAPDPVRGRRALVALNAAVVGEVAGLVLMRLAGHAWAALWYTAVLLLTATVARLVWSWRLFSRPEEHDRSLKFLRAAYVWLFISLGMLVALPLYQYGLLSWLAPESAAAKLHFSHAYYGAVRHAVTVGFVSLVIVGVAAKVVPTLNGVNVRSLPRLWWPFFLLNAGCALRVTMQALTDFTSMSFPFAGVSGVLEVTGLAIWGMGLWRIMKARVSRGKARAHTTLVPGAPVVAATVVADVLEAYPELQPVFLSFGFTPLANPLLRRLLAGTVTVGQACRFLGRDQEELLHALNAARASHTGRRRPLPMVAEGTADGERPAN